MTNLASTMHRNDTLRLSQITTQSHFFKDAKQETGGARASTEKLPETYSA